MLPWSVRVMSMSKCWTLVRVAVREDAEEGRHEDLDVEGDAQVVDVVGVVDRSLLDRGVLPEVVELSPAGYPRADLVPGRVSLDLLLEQGGEMRALRSRPHQAHLATQHVEDLGHLVEAGSAHETANPGDAGVVPAGEDGTGLSFGVRDHGAEFVGGERPPSLAHTLLPVDHRAGRVEPDGDRDDRHQGYPWDQQQDPQAEV